MGIGETYGGSSTANALQSLREMVVGTDAFEFEKTLKRHTGQKHFSRDLHCPAHYSSARHWHAWILWGRLSTGRYAACWAENIGGVFRSACLFFRYPSPMMGRAAEELPPEKLTDQARECVVEQNGFEALKFKGRRTTAKAGTPHVAQLLRERFRIFLIRFDQKACLVGLNFHQHLAPDDGV